MNADLAQAERNRLASQLREEQPPFVKDFTLALEEDLDGDPAVKVWMVVADDEVEGAEFPAHVELASTWISKALAASRIERWPYMSFRAESEVVSANSGSVNEPAE
jgi:hypothetical protein